MPMKKFIKIFFVVAMIFFASPNCFAENLKFVDAMDNTGYYVDMDTVERENPSVLRLNLILIKSDQNKMNVYDVRINHYRKTYSVLSSKVFAYDTRTELESNNQKRYERPYSDKSLMSEIVNFILYGGDLK